MCLARDCIKYSLVFACHFFQGERDRKGVCAREIVCLCAYEHELLVKKTTKLD